MTTSPGGAVVLEQPQGAMQPGTESAPTPHEGLHVVGKLGDATLDAVVAAPEMVQHSLDGLPDYAQQALSIPGQPNEFARPLQDRLVADYRQVQVDFNKREGREPFANEAYERMLDLQLKRTKKLIEEQQDSTSPELENEVMGQLVTVQLIEGANATKKAVTLNHVAQLLDMGCADPLRSCMEKGVDLMLAGTNHDKPRLLPGRIQESAPTERRPIEKIKQLLEAPFDVVEGDAEKLKTLSFQESEVAYLLAKASGKTGEAELCRIFQTFNGSDEVFIEDANFAMEAWNRLARSAPELADPARYGQAFAELRLGRNVHDGYRINDRANSVRDMVVASLWGNGREDVASRMITAKCDAETQFMHYIPQNVWGPEKAAEVANQIIHCATEKSDKVKKDLSELVASRAQLFTDYGDARLEDLIMMGADPETGLEFARTIVNGAGEQRWFSEALVKLRSNLERNSEILYHPLEEAFLQSDEPERFFATFKEIIDSPVLSSLPGDVLSQLRSVEACQAYLDICNHPLIESLQEPQLQLRTLTAVFGAKLENGRQLLENMDALGRTPYREEAARNQAFLIEYLAFSAKTAKGGTSLTQFFEQDAAHAVFENRFLRTRFMHTATGNLQEDSDKRLLNGMAELSRHSDLCKVLEGIADMQMCDSLIAYIINSPDIKAKAGVITEAFVSTGLLELILTEPNARAISGQIIQQLIRSPNPVMEAARFKKLLAGSNDLWHTLYEVSATKIGEIGSNGFQDGMVVKNIPLSLPVAAGSQAKYDQVSQAMEYTKFADLHVSERRMVGRFDGMSDEVVMAMTEVPFGMLAPEIQSAYLAHRLFEVLGRSQSVQEHEKATQRNIKFAEEGDWFRQGDLIHSTRPGYLPRILSYGMLAGEVTGFGGAKDSYPYNLDTLQVSSNVASIVGHGEQLNALENGAYGAVCLVMQRNPESLYYGEEFQGGYSGNHRLILGGMPSTEVSAILLRDPQLGVAEEVIGNVIDAQMYIPVVDGDGKLLLTYEQYEEKTKAVRDAVTFIDATANKSVEQALDTHEVHEIVERAKQFVLIGKLLEKPAGVWEGYRLDEHVEMVLNEFEQVARGVELPPEFPRDLMIKMLLLHDIGKPLSVELTGSTHSQHQYTRELITEYGPRFGIPADKVSLVADVASQDILGSVFQGGSEQEAVEKIQALAEKHKISLQHMFNVLTAYSFSDGSSYTEHSKYMSDGSVRQGINGTFAGSFTYQDDTWAYSPAQRVQLESLATQLGVQFPF